MPELTLSYRLPQFQKFTVNIQKYTTVENASELRSRLSDLPFAFIDARTVLSLEQLTSAVYKAILESEYNRMRTRNIHSECILSLSPSSNIGDALKRFGIKDESIDLIVIKITQDNEEEPFDGKTAVIGTLVPVTDRELALSADVEMIKEVCMMSFTSH